MNAEGQNTIYVYGGANMTMTPEDVINAKDAIINADFVVAQLEVPIPAIISAFEIAKALRCDDSIKSCTSESIT